MATPQAPAKGPKRELMEFAPAWAMFLGENVSIARTAWDIGFHLELVDGDIRRVEPNGEFILWPPMHTDLLADDWFVYEAPEK